jgi:hypothetical protein
MNNQSSGQSINNVNQFAIEAGKLFAKGDYAKAANLYIKASEAEPNNYTHFENVAICFYTNKSYQKRVEQRSS